MKTAPIALLFACFTLNSATAKDWPNWRGPNHNGISEETGLDLDWPKDGPKLLWQVDGCGKGYSSVAVSDGKIYTIGTKQGGEHLSAFREKDGELLWSTKFGTSGHSNGTPTVDGNLVYAIGRDGDLVCCNTSDGSIEWQKRFDKDFGGKMMSGWGYSESPLIDGELLICTPGGNDNMIVALDKKTGKKVWGTEVDDLGNGGKDGAGYSSIVISNGGGVKQYVQLTGRGIISVRAKDGELLWNYNRVANGTANIPTPIVAGDHIFCSTGYGTGSALLKIKKKGSTRADVEEVYFLDAKTLQNHHGGMIREGKYVYTGHKHNQGFPICVDITTGDIMWGGDERGPGDGSAAITMADGHLIFRYQNGVVALIEANPNEYKLKASFMPAHQEKESWAHPVIANGRLLLREQDKLMCYDVSK